MAIGAGIGASLGVATESSYGSNVTVTRFYEFNSENLAYRKKTAEGMGLRAGGQLPRSQRRVVTTTDAGGDLELDLPTRGLGLLLSYATGSTPSATTVSSGVYSYQFTLGDTYGKSFTTQVGVPQYGGTVTPKTLAGCKINNFELSVSNGDIAKGKFGIDAKSLVTSTALATVSYPATGSVFNFAQGAITLNGTSVANIKDFSVSIDNAIKVDRFNLGATGTKAEPNIAGFRKVSGKITAEFTDTTLLAAFLADSTASLALTFTGGIIASSYVDTLSITLPACKFDADTPNVSGPGVIDLAMTFTVYDNGTDAPVTIFYQTSESAL
jgi:Phage tail tube protein